MNYVLLLPIFLPVNANGSVAAGEERLMAIQEQLFRIQPAELVAYSGIVNWENLAVWIKVKVPECAVSVYQKKVHRSILRSILAVMMLPIL